MRKQKKVGTISLRVGSEMHQRVDDLAHSLGISTNGLLNLLLRRHLGSLAAELNLCQVWDTVTEQDNFVRILRTYRKAYPQSTKEDFYAELSKVVRGEPCELRELVDHLRESKKVVRND